MGASFQDPAGPNPSILESPMARPQKLPESTIFTWLETHAGWTLHTEGDQPGALVRTYRFPDFAAALAFVVRIGCAAEKRDHHPDVELGWGRVRLAWSTHDAGGVTELDLQLAETSDASLAGFGEKPQ
jgi:4a-hydroxytetrahydrobiopterin dehydratase